MDRGLVRSLDRAEELGCETVQLFSGSPSSWQRKPVDVESAGVFSARARSLDIHPIIIHRPYLVNLAAPDDEIWRKSRQSLLDAMQRAPLLGASIVVTHIGSHKGEGHAGGVARICDAVTFALESTEQTSVALELGSGAGNSIGSRFEEFGEILACLPQHADRVGICIDTAHLWGSGYDISTRDGVQGMFDELDRHVGLGKLWLVHLNDTLYGTRSYAQFLTDCQNTPTLCT